MILNCGVGEDCWESLGLKEIQSVHRKGGQSWCSLEGLMFKLKLQYFGHLMWRADPFEKTLMLRKMEGRQRRGLQWMRWLDGITASMDISLVSSRSWWWTARLGVLKSMESQRVGHNWVTNLNLASFQVFFHHLYDFFGEMTIKSACFFTEVFFCVFLFFFCFFRVVCVCVCVCVCVLFCFDTGLHSYLYILENNALITNGDYLCSTRNYPPCSVMT